MTWTTPKTWQVDELVTAADMNTHIRDNLNALKSPPNAVYTPDETGDYTTQSGSFEAVDATNLALTLTTNGGDLLVHLHATVKNSASARIYFDVTVDGTRVAGDDGIIATALSDSPEVVSFTRLVSGLSAGEHTVTLVWKVSAGTATLYAGAGTSGLDLHPQFWAREVS